MTNLRQKWNQVRSLAEPKQTPVSLESLEEKLDKVIELLTIISEREQIVQHITKTDVTETQGTDMEFLGDTKPFIPQIDTEGMKSSAKTLSTGIKSRDISGNLKALKELQSGEDTDG